MFANRYMRCSGEITIRPVCKDSEGKFSACVSTYFRCCLCSMQKNIKSRKICSGLMNFHSKLRLRNIHLYFSKCEWTMNEFGIFHVLAALKNSLIDWTWLFSLIFLGFWFGASDLYKVSISWALCRSMNFPGAHDNHDWQPSLPDILILVIWTRRTLDRTAWGNRPLMVFGFFRNINNVNTTFPGIAVNG